jgi:hypothetical protein
MSKSLSLASRTLTCTLCVFSFVLFLASCGKGDSQKKEESDNWAKPEVIRPDIMDMEPFHYSDTITIKSRLLRYTFNFAPDESLPVVINSEGQKYHDCAATLIVEHEGDTIFHQRFTKQHFSEYTSHFKEEQVALIAFNYNNSRIGSHDILSFLATVGDPDESLEMETTIEIRILQDGKYALQKAEGLETEPLVPNLRQDPENFEK